MVSRAVVRRALTFVMVLAAAGTETAYSQTYEVIYNFTGVPDGSGPESGLTMDAAGNLFGTTTGGGDGLCNGSGCGTVFKLAYRNSKWSESQLYSFAGGSDGAFPHAGVIIGPGKSLYGATIQGGALGCDCNCGTVFMLSPPSLTSPSWTETQLHQFTAGTDGYFPGTGDLVFDPETQSLYGTTSGGGIHNQGTVYKVQYSNGSWTESVIYSFNGADGGNPYAGVIVDKAGALYGTTAQENPSGYGTVFQLSPSGSSWIETTLYSFQNGSDGSFPVGGVISDRYGNLYGTTSAGGSGSGGGGTVFELTSNLDGSWTFHLLYSFPGNYGGGPQNSLVMDAAGSIYGTTQSDGEYFQGSVFKLTRRGRFLWSYTSLHDFSGGTDGYFPYGNLVLDESGNLYGTAVGGGNGCCGVVFKSRP